MESSLGPSCTVFLPVELIVSVQPTTVMQRSQMKLLLFRPVCAMLYVMLAIGNPPINGCAQNNNSRVNHTPLNLVLIAAAMKFHVFDLFVFSSPSRFTVEINQRQLKILVFRLRYHLNAKQKKKEKKSIFQQMINSCRILGV